MKCPRCGQEDSHDVIDSRRSNCGYITRRRLCSCGYRFRTIEVAVADEKTMVALRRMTDQSCGKHAFDKLLDKFWHRVFENSMRKISVPDDAGDDERDC